MERECGFRVDNGWLPERAGLVRLAFNGREEKCLISRGCGWTHILPLARKLLAAEIDDDGVHVLAVFLVIDAGAHQGRADVMRILAWLAAPRARAKEMPTIGLADLPYDARCHLFDKKAVWRLPVLRRLAAQVAGASPIDQIPWVDIPAWLDAVAVVGDYRDSLDLATKRDLIVRDIPSRVATAPCAHRRKGIARGLVSAWLSAGLIAAARGIAGLEQAGLRVNGRG